MEFDIQQYLSDGVEQVVKDAMKATLKDPRESAFIAKFAFASAKANKKRIKEEKEGLHVPSYLIASITSSCNLHCTGCYSRANDATVDCEPEKQLTDEEWLRIFKEAEELGISFILLAGGEPMLRWDVLQAAGSIPNILFPIFTNGTFMSEKYMALLDSCRNLIPVISIEGDRSETDRRRGEGVYDTVISKMDELHRRGLIYGVSVTVIKENLHEVYSDEFLDLMRQRGCKAVFYIEYVPVTDESKELAPDDADRDFMNEKMHILRANHQEMMYVAFPGDEKSSGGCLAAGRGFFHINSHGGAEPCPFSAYSDINVKDTSVREALGSLYGIRALVVAIFLFIAPKNMVSMIIYAFILGMTGDATVTPTSEIISRRFGARTMAFLFGITYVCHQIGAFISSWLGGIFIDNMGNYELIWMMDIVLCAMASLVSFRISSKSGE